MNSQDDDLELDDLFDDDLELDIIEEPVAPQVKTIITPEGENKPKRLGLKEGDKIQNYYELKCLLKRGGCGEVWKAYNPNLDNMVAIKFMYSDQNHPQYLVHIKRFKREGQILANINHPNIATVHDMGYDELIDRYYIIMEYIDGGDLGSVQKHNKPFATDDAIAIIKYISSALKALLSKKIIHRDIKPANIMATTSGEIKLVDLGVAKLQEGNDVCDAVLTQENSVVGTPHFISPEQITSGSVDHRSDIYSLGCTFFLLLTGKFVFSDATDSNTIMKNHIAVTPVKPSDLYPKIPLAIDNIIMRMLEKNPDDRFQSYDELLAELDNYLNEKNINIDHSTYTSATLTARSEEFNLNISINESKDNHEEDSNENKLNQKKKTSLKSYLGKVLLERFISLGLACCILYISTLFFKIPYQVLFINSISFIACSFLLTKFSTIVLMLIWIISVYLFRADILNDALVNYITLGSYCLLALLSIVSFYKSIRFMIYQNKS